MKFNLIIFIILSILALTVFSGLIRKKENREKKNLKVFNETFKLTLKKPDVVDEVFGKSDIFKGVNGNDNIEVLHLKYEIDTPAGYTAKSTVGILKTDLFYFLFPWETCVDNENLSFSKMTGLLELAHGTNKKIMFTLNPFEPKGKHVWKLHHTAPFGSISNGPTDQDMLNARLFSTSVIDFTKDAPHSVHTLWDVDETNEITEYRKEGVHSTKKFKENRKKYVTGTNDPKNHHKIMDLELAKFRVGKEFQSDHLPKMLRTLRICTTIGLVITRNRTTKTSYLSDLLEAIDKYGFPTNLVISSCRYRGPEKIWFEKWNLGPKAYFALGEKDDTFAIWYNGAANGKQVDFTE